jgi:hypothetical protein
VSELLYELAGEDATKDWTKRRDGLKRVHAQAWWDRARNAGKRQKNQGLRKATAGMLMQRSFNAVRVSNMLGLLIHVSDDRIRGVLGPKAAIGRSNSVAMCG